MIPDILLDPASSAAKAAAADAANRDDSSPNGNNGSPPLANNKPNKGVILTKSVEYIRYLQQMVALQIQRNRDLETRLYVLEGGSPGDDRSQRESAHVAQHAHFSTLHDFNQNFGLLETVEERMNEEEARDPQHGGLFADDFLGTAGTTPSRLSENGEDGMRA